MNLKILLEKQEELQQASSEYVMQYEKDMNSEDDRTDELRSSVYTKKMEVVQFILKDKDQAALVCPECHILEEINIPELGEVFDCNQCGQDVECINIEPLEWGIHKEQHEPE